MLRSILCSRGNIVTLHTPAYSTPFIYAIRDRTMAKEGNEKREFDPPLSVDTGKR